MAAETSIPKGTRDFGPDEMIRRNYIFDTVRSVFKRYGYLPVETPAMENLSTLLGKYGDEGDRLLFRILNSGDFMSKLSTEEKSGFSSASLMPLISDKGLRYDLTVPFARFIVQHRNDITFPFKRYQIQPVWRADRPQKGRYREFYQCDVDVIGSDSVYNEYELVRIIDDLFDRLGIKVLVKLNNRKILAGIAEVIGEPGRIIEITVAIDKMEKIGIDGVVKELEEKGIPKNSIEALKPILFLEGDNSSKLEGLRKILASSEQGLKGIEEMEQLFSYIDDDRLESAIELDLTLARGLNYYTGAIIEVKAADYTIGSICGGGRYDNLAGVFGMEGVSGVGVSFGADRIYDVMYHLGLFPDHSRDDVKVLFINFGEAEERYSIKVLKALRAAGISSELYPDRVKMKKQMAYANARKIPFVALAGEKEIEEGTITIKNMETGSQEMINVGTLVSYLTPAISE